MATLKIDNVTKSFGSVDVLKGINLSIDSGEFLILVGPSGCGKSTLMNSIAGLEEVSSGAIHIGDTNVTGLAPKDRDIAMVFQSYALYPSMTVRGNIAFALEIRKVPKAQREQEVQRVAELLQISHLLDRKPSQLSGGQRQRVAMGRALARHPKVYLFDEPLSNLDAKLRVEMRTEIKKLHQRLNTTIVYVTHDQIEAMTLADRIAVMKDGIVQQFDTPQEIYDNPANMFVAGFMGSPAMNFLRCTLCCNNGHYSVLVTTSDGTQYQWPLQHAADDLDDWIEKEVILGIRPEQITHLIPHKETLDSVTHFTAAVDVAEPTGPDTLVLISLNDQEVGCRVEPKEQQPVGNGMRFMVDMSNAVLFNPDTEERIL
ncbi:sn-glycerol-3-phosphate ABC transporter ATP-binding protein UgpC [Aestuariirhabdus sp. Z084]|uniref:ABC transporter ATP-binding protein n=1 Tax=Aestuariirhabdus haliotis TaxID=2918751 RepID=UPI00201B3C0C|nr:sn-glycerol-3-phosphate ABC transporter ATP-binding protein UgpC [Aestuariirhabdus haliotis]MCL6417079.1 sn-glycerol-3-phosphate ABC transporter ATP-binding protein UgpC [Aestuariirhabdus haliotis]MCL6420990.1 sn-glycerol-3-phosphate ABC transporter ATP-binding protein UgpC [Aestuariirhabdus haliotis]